VKNTKPQAKDKEREERNKHTKDCWPSSVQTWPNLGERLISPIHYRWVLTKRYKWVTRN